MKKRLLWATALLWLSLTLAWCNCNCDKQADENGAFNEAMQYCVDNWGTHSIIHTQTAVYGECAFPSWIACEDDLLLSWECDFHPNLDSIDTEEKRFAGCEESVQWWMRDFEAGSENVVVDWGEESEWWASFIRNGVIRYTKDWSDWRMTAECVADFVDWSLSISYGEAEPDYGEEVYYEEWETYDEWEVYYEEWEAYNEWEEAYYEEWETYDEWEVYYEE